MTGLAGYAVNMNVHVACTLESNPSARAEVGLAVLIMELPLFNLPHASFPPRTPFGTTCPFMICLSVKHLLMVKFHSGLFILMQTVA